MKRWKFVTKDGATTYVFEFNPNKHAAFEPVRNYRWNVGRGPTSGTRSGVTPHPSSFSGVVRSKAQFDAFVEWVEKRQRIFIDTDLGQRLDARLVAFRPVAEGGSRQASPHRHTYDMDILIFNLTEAPA